MILSVTRQISHVGNLHTFASAYYKAFIGPPERASDHEFLDGEAGIALNWLAKNQVDKLCNAVIMVYKQMPGVLTDTDGC